ncbi:hypothetical protein H072_11085 [Dactylellina haptotyla CBS 200.50]|uniref:Uncharacterized protein n=1 Tax=Dactylellina haptotyla (strain CBS 200.50) TaxID=1284197 RepID=S7ZXN0_DACHA|nr:hypothetical protein H072_11085 [Dactylellina haptotyla CBS 200.50]
MRIKNWIYWFISIAHLGRASNIELHSHGAVSSNKIETHNDNTAWFGHRIFKPKKKIGITPPKKTKKGGTTGLFKRDDGDDPPLPEDPKINIDDPLYARWIKPPGDDTPHMDYNCRRENTPEEGLSSAEIREVSRYLIWQLVNNTMNFVARPSDPEFPCYPVYCHYPASLVTLCNHKPNPALNAIIIPARDVGRYLWDLYQLTYLDTVWVKRNWEGGVRPCRDPESRDTSPLIDSFMAWARWTADEWEVIVSREMDKAGCDRWKGSPEWITTGGGAVAAGVPMDFFGGIPRVWGPSW